MYVKFSYQPVVDLASNLFRFRTSEKSARNPFRMSSSKLLDLKSFRMRTYEKTGGEGYYREPAWDN